MARLPCVIIRQHLKAPGQHKNRHGNADSIKQITGRPVSRVLSCQRFPPEFNQADQPNRGNHSSGRAIADCALATNPGLLGAKHSCLPKKARDPYAVLLRVGFAMRAALPRPRCAFTAPFHPCLCPLGVIGGILSVALSLSLALGLTQQPHPAGVTRHPCFVEPGLSSLVLRLTRLPGLPVMGRIRVAARFGKRVGVLQLPRISFQPNI